MISKVNRAQQVFPNLVNGCPASSMERSTNIYSMFLIMVVRSFMIMISRIFEAGSTIFKLQCEDRSSPRMAMCRQWVPVLIKMNLGQTISDNLVDRDQIMIMIMMGPMDIGFYINTVLGKFGNVSNVGFQSSNGLQGCPAQKRAPGRSRKQSRRANMKPFTERKSSCSRWLTSIHCLRNI